MKFPRSELYLVTGHNSLPLGKVVLSMGSRSLFQVHSFLSRLSHAVEQAMGWATVQRVNTGQSPKMQKDLGDGTRMPKDSP